MIDLAGLERAVDRAAVRYDRAGDQHYDVISAFIKSIRGSDADAALHYLARMIEAGEDPRFIARRLIVHASEDVGMADPTALPVAVAAAQAVEFVGLPEARINLAQAVIHLSLAPKSNAVVRAIGAAQADVQAGLAGRCPRTCATPATAARRGSGTGAVTSTRMTIPRAWWPRRTRPTRSRGAGTTSRPGTAPRPGTRSGPSGSGRSWAAPSRHDERWHAGQSTAGRPSRAGRATATARPAARMPRTAAAGPLPRPAAVAQR